MKSRSVKSSNPKWKTILLIFGTILLFFIVYYFFRHNYFRDPKALQRVIAKAGIYGPLVFIVFQAFQVLFPILPGGVSGSLAMLCFGTWKGFFYSYIGVLIGSSLVFLLVRKYGKRLLRHFVDQQTFDKYDQKLQNSKNFSKLFAIGIFLPIAPDDLLCMIAGLSSISFWKFFLIIVLGKPISSFLYSYFIVKFMGLI